MLGQDAEKLLRLLGGLQIEIMLADDALGIARLQRRLANGTELGDEKADERMPHHVMGEREFLCHFFADVLKVRRNDREFLEWLGPQPRPEVWLNRDVARFAHLRDLAVDADHPRVEVDVFWLESEDFAGAETGTDARPSAG